jgi:hypothetical protein
MSAIDIGVVIVLALALLIGWWRGLLRPLIVWAFIVAGVVVGFVRPSVAVDLAPSPGWRPVMGVVVVAAFALGGVLIARLVGRLIYRHIRVIGLLDRVAGAALSLALAGVAVFILLSAIVTLDQAAAPVEGTGAVSAARIAQIQSYVAAHPGSAILLDPAQLQALQQRPGLSTTPAADIGQLNGPLGFLRALHAQVVGSRVAPVIFNWMQTIPVLGGGQRWPAS